ncbi:MAG: tRNA 2-selenouridine(34) synthase MnmH, partial [Pseudohongiellaceae bacterium]
MARSANHELLNEADFARLFLEDIPLLDVRAPVEFRHGAFPCATNIPLLEDDEREQVGKVYKQAGRDAALALGHRLVSGSTKDQRLANWSDFYHRHPNAALYCFRGGQRSKIAQQWLAEAGISIPRVAGGYKSMRRFLINSIAFPVANTPLLILGGKTGSGKTR